VTRQANPDIKDNLHVRAKNESERRLIGDLKQLARQDGVELSELVFEGILLMFKAHHWPPGNPQLQLTVFQKEQPPPTNNNNCTCGQPIEVTYGFWTDTTTHKSCKHCFNKIPHHKIQHYQLKKQPTKINK
jgi:hypothetical protein